ncbi:MAG: S41 family peptidase [Marinilabiliaceae bacterium]|nr:S41 family peptidase [Marinilabiliaceae bacterium]
MKIRTIVILFLFLSVYVKAQRADAELSNIHYTWQIINGFYVDSVDKQMISREAIVSMLKKLDPHSVFIPSEEVQESKAQLDGNFEGVGVEFVIMNDTLTVVNAIIGGPSEKVGITAGDRIVSIDGQNVASVGLKNSDVFKYLRGDKGTVVELTILRRGEKNLLHFKVKRDKIPIHSIDAAYMLTPKTGYIKISRFSLTTYDEFSTELKKLKKSKAQNLILDLRGNGGGYMQAALDIADDFLDGNKMMLYTQGNLSPLQLYNSTNGGLWEQGRLIILIDESSASASEIVSGAVQDYDRGIIMGRRSFGKGLVQRIFPLPDKSEVRLTTAKYYTPSGRCIQKPYSDDSKEYRNEIKTRYEHGEFTNPDSIQLNSDQQYKTKVNNRNVYGGGGIMPDVFVPLDTSMITNFYRNLISSGVYNQFMMTYLDNNRSLFTAKYKNFEQFNTQFNVDEDFFNLLLIEAQNKDIETEMEEVDVSKPFIKLLMKSYIARNLWSSNEYFQIMNTTFPIIQQAVDLIENKADYELVLK